MFHVKQKHAYSSGTHGPISRKKGCIFRHPLFRALLFGFLLILTFDYDFVDISLLSSLFLYFFVSFFLACITISAELIVYFKYMVDSYHYARRYSIIYQTKVLCPGVRLDLKHVAFHLYIISTAVNTGMAFYQGD